MLNFLTKLVFPPLNITLVNYYSIIRNSLQKMATLYNTSTHTQYPTKPIKVPIFPNYSKIPKQRKAK